MVYAKDEEKTTKPTSKGDQASPFLRETWESPQLGREAARARLASDLRNRSPLVTSVRVPGSLHNIYRTILLAYAWLGPKSAFGWRGPQSDLVPPSQVVAHRYLPKPEVAAVFCDQKEDVTGGEGGSTGRHLHGLGVVAIGPLHVEQPCGGNWQPLPSIACTPLEEGGASSHHGMSPHPSSG